MLLYRKLRKHERKVKHSQLDQIFLSHFALKQLPELDHFLLEQRVLRDHAQHLG
jgi:hypothetical protein